jgi:hypothetical protein
MVAVEASLFGASGPPHADRLRMNPMPALTQNKLLPKGIGPSRRVDARVVSR